MKLNQLLVLLIVLNLLGCKSDGIEKSNKKKQINNSIKYATYIELYNYTDYTHLLLKNNISEKEQSYYLVDKTKEVPTFLNNETVIRTPIETIVVTSTTHSAMLELLGVESSLIAFPQTNFISSSTTRKRIDSGFVKDLGNVQQMNTELLLSLKPDIIISFEITGTNNVLKELENKGSTVLVNNDWLEKTPLGRAEWLLFFGALFNKTNEAEAIFKSIENNYNEAKNMALNATKSPTVLSGIVFNDVWNMPAGKSFEAQLFKDANTTYLWGNTNATGSLLLSIETVLEKAQDADFWINPGIFTQYNELKKSNTMYSHFKPFKRKQIFTHAHLRGATGGYKYYETAPTRPDLVLKDLIKMAHPELMHHYNFTFYKKME